MPNRWRQSETLKDPVSFTAKFERSQLERLGRLADSRQTYQGELLRRALTEYLERVEKSTDKK